MTDRAARRVVAVGGSAGGLEPLLHVVRELPADLPAAVLVVLHMAAAARSRLAPVLDRAGHMDCALRHARRRQRRAAAHARLGQRHGGARALRVRIGHRVSAETLLELRVDEVEGRALWASVRALEEQASLAQRLGERAGSRGDLLTPRAGAGSAEPADAVAEG